MPGIWHWSQEKGMTQDSGRRSAWNDVYLDCQGVQQAGWMLLMVCTGPRGRWCCVERLKSAWDMALEPRERDDTRFRQEICLE